MSSAGVPIQQPILLPNFSPGTEFRISRQKFRLTRILHAPDIAFTAHFTTTRDGAVISERYAQVYQVACLANKAGEPFDYFLEVYYWADSGIENGALKAKRGKSPGATEEPDGTAVLTLEKIDSSKDISLDSYNLVYIWRVEKSLDPKGSLLAYKQEFSEYLGKYLTPGCTITLAGGHKYSIESFLSAEGAFGTIFKASLLGTNKPVVLKFQEARVGVNEALALREFYGHPGIVRFVQASEVIGYSNPREVIADRNPLSGDIAFQQKQGQQKLVRFQCVVAEYVQGKNIAQFIEDYKDNSVTQLYDWIDNIPLWGKRGDKLVGLGDCVSYIEQLSDAVDFIHQKGYVHLDIKPQNIMLDGENTLQIVDMGSVSKLGSGVFAFGQGNHAAPEVKEYLVNANRTSSMWLQRFVANVQSTWQAGTNIPDNLLNLLRSGMTEEQRKLQQQCEIESKVAYQKIAAQSDVFSVGAMFSSLISGQNPRQVAMPDENSPTKVGRIMLYEENLPIRRKAFIPVLRKAMSIDVGQRFQTCWGFKQAMQATYTNLVFNETLISGLMMLLALMGLAQYFSGIPIEIAGGIFSVPALGFLIWRIVQWLRQPVLTAIQLRPYSIASTILTILILFFGLAYLISTMGGWLYAERAYLSFGIDQSDIKQITPQYVKASPPQQVSVDTLVFDLGVRAYKSGNGKEAKAQFQTYLKMYQNKLGLSSEQINDFNTATANQLASFISNNPLSDVANDVALIMVIIEPSKRYQATKAMSLYNSPDLQSSSVLTISKDNVLMLLSTDENGWYKVWFNNSLYFAQLDRIQK